MNLKTLCPRCSKPLINKQNILYCLDHGVLLRHDDLKRLTSKKFSQYFWIAWFKFNQIGGLKCPDCLVRMIILNPETNKNVELDCCANCYSIWLDKGEASDIHMAFLAFEAQNLTDDKIKEISNLQNLIGKELIAQDKRIQRYKKITAVSEALTQRLKYRFLTGLNTFGVWDFED
jgi:Zn-finger nucleic acid-binding protein